MSDVKWIKITTDIFDDEKILLIESLPDAYAIITCWFKLLCLAGKMNNSGVFVMNNRVAYTDKMLSVIFRMKESTVNMALKTFQDFGMIEVSDGVISIPNWNKHQNVDRLTEIREYNRLAKQKSREKQKLLTSQTEVNDKSIESQQCQRIDKEEESEKEENIYKRIVQHLNDKAHTAYRASSAKTKTAIHARLAECFKEPDFYTVIDKKCAEWIGTEFEKFLRPETLFGSKFEEYLNQNIIRPVKKGAYSGFLQRGTDNINFDDISLKLD